MNKWGKRLAILGIFILPALVAYVYIKQPKPIAVRVYTVQHGLVKATVSNTRVGTVKACRRAYLAPATGGELTKLNIRKGDQVTKQQVLLEVWNNDLKARIELQNAEIKTKQLSAKQACYVADGAERIARRAKELHKHKGLISEERVDDVVTAAMAKRAACYSARAAVQAGHASLNVARAAYEHTLLRAPFDGTVAEINAELGEFVTPTPVGIPTLPAIDLLDLSCLYISAPIDEVDAPLIQLDMQASVSLDAFPEKHFPGKVTRIAPYVLEKEKQARTVEVEVTLHNPEQLRHLLPGYSADIEVLLNSKEQALRIPTEAVLENNRVFLIDTKGRLLDHSFQPGLSNWDYTEILSGLEAGDKVVLSIGREGVEAGAYVIAEK
jgi:HlyD family secretion protein